MLCSQRGNFKAIAFESILYRIRVTVTNHLTSTVVVFGRLAALNLRWWRNFLQVAELKHRVDSPCHCSSPARSHSAFVSENDIPYDFSK